MTRGISEQSPTLIGAKEIQDAVRQVLCFEHRGLIEEVAEMLGMNVETVRTQLDSRRAKSVLLDIVRAAEFKTGDRRLGRILLWPGRMAAADPGELPCCDDPNKEGVDVVVALGEALKAVQEAVADDEVSLGEAREVLGLVDKVRHELAEFEASVRQACPAVVRAGE